VTIRLKLFASLTGHLAPADRRAGAMDLELAPGTTIAALIDQRGLPRQLCTLVLVNGVFVPPGELERRVLAEGDVLAIWPPVGGG
jgi:thiamine biosynthesis protein ThiS